jgi:2-keto-3-deoxy-L-rhamnonate aldolase RhmA
MKNILKEKIAGGRVCIGGWNTVRSPEVAEALDMEHGSFSVGDAESAFLACERHGCTPLARLPNADPILARRLLDSGAHGFLVPHTDDAAAFAEFASHCYFPPAGRRGLSLERFNLWGDNFDESLLDFEPILVPMIESKKGIENVAEIAALPAVDALFFGPYDLSADLGVPGDFVHPSFLDALAAVKQAGKDHGKAVGGHQVAPDPAALDVMIDDGFTFIAFGTDMIAMRTALKTFADRSAP